MKQQIKNTYSTKNVKYDKESNKWRVSSMVEWSNPNPEILGSDPGHAH